MKISHKIIFQISFFILIAIVIAFLIGMPNISEKSINNGSGDCFATAVSMAESGSSRDPQLKKFAEYQKRCGGAFSREMVFAVFPETEKGARESALLMAEKLKEFSKLGIKPIVIVEPVNDQGKILDFAMIAAGAYRKPLEAYFKGLSNGITANQMGLWVPLPEPNTDSWGIANANPVDFMAAYSAYGDVFKKYFPAGCMGPLLDNETYLWDIGETSALSLEKYVRGINRNYVDFFGLQGFPWPVASASGLETIYSAAEFLSAARAIESANILGVRSIWFNTGTFSSFSNNGEKSIPLAITYRSKILNDILGQLAFAKDAGFSVIVNIFSENKINTSEGIDWSYWHSASAADADDGAALCEFARKTLGKGIALSVFDTEQ